MQSNGSPLLPTVLRRTHTLLPLFLASVGCCLAVVGATADTLDKTDCDGVVLDDSQFAEPMVRDHRDNGYGAFSNPAMRPLGGGKGYGRGRDASYPAPPARIRTCTFMHTALTSGACGKTVVWARGEGPAVAGASRQPALSSDPS